MALNAHRLEQLDGNELQNSPFAIALSRHLPTEGIIAERMFKRVGAQVEDISQRLDRRYRQEPWVEGNLRGADFCFNGCDGSGIAASVEEETRALNRAYAEGKVGSLRAFLKAYPGSQSRSLVEARIAELETPETTFTEVIESITLTGYPAGDTFRDTLSGGGQGPEMVVVPGGTFRMGSNDGASDEKPVHSVTIPRNFAVGKFEVTWSEWGACVADGGCNSSGPEGAGGDNGWGKGNRPVIEVDWSDAKAYVRWLSRKTGEDYRLLSEAEWEYAARAGSTGKYSWGNNDPSCSKGATNSANYSACSSDWTESVGFSSANAFGLHDLHGNVWEWTEDCWNGSYSGAPSNGSAWLSGDCERRVLRGGSWDSYPLWLRSAVRVRDNTTVRSNLVGFRIARTL